MPAKSRLDGSRRGRISTLPPESSGAQTRFQAAGAKLLDCGRPPWKLACQPLRRTKQSRLRSSAGWQPNATRIWWENRLMRQLGQFHLKTLFRTLPNLDNTAQIKKPLNLFAICHRRPDTSERSRKPLNSFSAILTANPKGLHNTAQGNRPGNRSPIKAFRPEGGMLRFAPCHNRSVTSWSIRSTAPKTVNV